MYKISYLPFTANFETHTLIRKLILAHRALAELKGVTELIPNQNILINTLSLQEAKDSSAIENIITTHDELYKNDNVSIFSSRAAKEVHSYAKALRNSYEKIKSQGLLTNNIILEIQSTIEGNTAGFRSLPGTELKNDQTGEIVYTPPQDPKEVQLLMVNLEKYINDDTLSDLDPLIKMAIIHHQFESIHPFYDGNGRTGRIINVLYLVKNKLLNTPILYLSRYINKNKSNYYCLLQKVQRDKNAWQEWIAFFLDAVLETSHHTILLIHKIQGLMQLHKNQIREKLPKIYSQDLLNNLFCHPYTKIEFVSQDLQIHRNTASRYLEELEKIGLLSKHRLGSENFYVNTNLYNLLCGLSLDSKK